MTEGNYSATSTSMKLVQWPLMGGLLNLEQRGGDWVEPTIFRSQVRRPTASATAPPVTVLLYNNDPLL